MTRARTLTAVAASAALVVGVAAQALADRWDRADRVGDGPAVADISHLTIANRSEALRIVVEFDDLVPADTGRDFFVIDTQRKDRYDYILYTRWRKAGVRSRLIRAVPFSDSDAHRVTCPDLAVHWRAVKDRIAVSVPQSCLRRPTPLLRAGFHSIDRPVTDDDWAPRQYATYGPWVDVG